MSSSFSQQIEDFKKALRGKRVGMLTNPSAVGPDLSLTMDYLHKDPDIKLTALFGPEHGVRGDQQAGLSIEDYIDSKTGLPVYSLYGNKYGPAPEHLENLDVLVFDIQDVGARFYTYIWTMTYAMESAARAGIEFLVFDRPNPLMGHRVEGPPNTEDYGLIGRVFPGQEFGVPIRHGMTVGELARLVNDAWLQTKVQLQVISIPEYTRSTSWEQTSRIWIPPSPNIPTLDTAYVFPATCVFEGTNISEGRGTTKPFELIGAPFIDGHALVEQLIEYHLAGVFFRPACFTPTFNKYAGELCNGIQLHLTNRNDFDPVQAGLSILQSLIQLYEDKVEINNHAEKIMGISNLRKRLKRDSTQDFTLSWMKNLRDFCELRNIYLLYPVF